MAWSRPSRVLWLLAVAPMIGGTPVVAGAQSSGKTGVTTSVKVFLVAIGDQGKAGPRIGCGDSLVAVTKKIAPTKAPLTAALRLTIGNHKQFLGQSGLYNALYQAHLTLNKATVSKGTATIHLTGKLRLGGVCDAPRVRAQLRHAALQFHTVDRVYVYVNGVPLSRAVSSR